MLSYLRKQTVTITIGVSFFVFGFFIVANLLRLSDRGILVGLISGAIGGATLLLMARAEERKSQLSAGTA